MSDIRTPWLKQAMTRKPGSKVETHNTLRFQGAMYKPGEKATIGQKKIMNTTFIFPAANTRSVKAP